MTSAAESGTHKLWGGRFAGGPAPELEAVNRSIGTDIRLWPFDLALSKAWARALGEGGVLSTAEADALVEGLGRVSERIGGGAQPIASDEDVHTFIDRILHDEAGDVASKLHTGRSRNDQVATATRLWTVDAIEKLDTAVRELQRAMIDKAAELGDAIMPAYTHLQRAQPVLASHWMLSHFWPLARDRDRLAHARSSANVLPLGSGAVAGTAFPVSRERLRDLLDFVRVSENSVDAVGDRDFILDVLHANSVLCVHLSRLAEDLILFGSSEFGFVRFGDAYSTGSSMMPQKRNPDALEIARGSAARALGAMVSMFATSKGLPSGYNKDLQDDKRALFDSVDSLLLLLPAVTGSLRTLAFNRDRMATAVTSTMMATDLADYLVRRGATFRDAHGAVGRLVREAEEKGVELTALPPASFSAAHGLFGPDVMKELEPSTSVGHRSATGGTAPKAVIEQLAAARASLGL